MDIGKMIVLVSGCVFILVMTSITATEYFNHKIKLEVIKAAECIKKDKEYGEDNH